MKTMFMLMGVIGTGKSTLAQKLSKENGGEIFSSDDLRTRLAQKGIIPNDYSPKYNKMIFSRLHEKVEEALAEGKNVIIDSTNVEQKARKFYIELAKKYRYKVEGYLLMLEDEECIRRVEKRQKGKENTPHYIKNVHSVLAKMKAKLTREMPRLEEGFDEIKTLINEKLVKKEGKILISSTNLGKIEIYANVLRKLGIPYTSLRELDPQVSIEENGKTELENSYLKAKGYHEATGLPVIANDSGLVIDKFKDEDQPGVFVRRYGGKELTDEETIKIFSQKLLEVGGESDSHFNVALTLCDQNGEYHSRLFKSYRYMVSTPSPVVQKGLPLRSLDYNKELKKYMSEMTIEEANLAEGDCIKQQAEFIKEVFKK